MFTTKISKADAIVRDFSLVAHVSQLKREGEFRKSSRCVLWKGTKNTRNVSSSSAKLTKNQQIIRTWVDFKLTIAAQNIPQQHNVSQQNKGKDR